MMDAPTVGSLFSGIGGLDLGLERAGWRVAFQVESDPYCQRVLAKHWPDVPRWSDIREVNPDDLPRVDLLAGGFPCQPVSVAGKRRGQDDERWLWPEFARLIRALRPRYALMENVPGLLVRGFGDVLGDLAACGYDAEWDCIPAAAVGAPHIRDRVFILAYPAGDAGQLQSSQRSHLRDKPTVDGAAGTIAALADPDGEGQLQPGGVVTEEWRWAGDGGQPLADATGNGREQGRASAGQGLREPCGRSDPLAYSDFQGLEVGRARWAIDDGPATLGNANRASPDALAAGRGPRGAVSQSGWWDVEPDVGRVAHGVPARVDRLRGLGNAVVPHVAQWIGERLLER